MKFIAIAEFGSSDVDLDNQARILIYMPAELFLIWSKNFNFFDSSLLVIFSGL